ncbi:hypothetical protein [Streptomyces sp. 7-21]|jgi:MFS family permease|uniref:hypothetical protein n=1 Tax=Streptomyces sp. 7-21 TaxID=2802283 RepID=UPI00191D8684|nr:hypothetical protein [Streptomyces sp. 7-21]MBL1067477.1 hypothetical protein [Streptomyces sp. 7-21]
MRNALATTLGAILAIATAVTALASPFLDWYGDRNGRDYKWWQLFTGDGITGESANLFTGLFLPMLAAAIIAIIAIPLRSATLMGLAGVLILGFTILWMIRQYQDNDALTIGENGLGEGVGLGLVSGVLGLLAAAATFGRTKARHRRDTVERTAGPAPPRERYEGRREGSQEGDVVEGPWGTEEPHRKRRFGRGRDAA